VRCCLFDIDEEGLYATVYDIFNCISWLRLTLFAPHLVPSRAKQIPFFVPTCVDWLFYLAPPCRFLFVVKKKKKKEVSSSKRKEKHKKEKAEFQTIIRQKKYILTAQSRVSYNEDSAGQINTGNMTYFMRSGSLSNAPMPREGQNCFEPLGQPWLNVGSHLLVNT
jgi:hypothetical protein